MPQTQEWRCSWTGGDGARGHPALLLSVNMKQLMEPGPRPPKLESRMAVIILAPSQYSWEPGVCNLPILGTAYK